LGELRIASLPVGEETREILERWGVRTLRELCALPEAGVRERLGAEGATLLKLARGEKTRPLRVERAATSYEAQVELDHPIALLEPLLFPAARLLNELCDRLRRQAMATSEIQFMLELENRSTQTRILQLPFATHDARALLKLLQLDLEAHPVQGAVTILRVKLKPVEARVVQHGLYTPPAPEPEKLELTLGKIRGLVGKDNAGWPALIDTHRPDAWRMRTSSPGLQTLVYEKRAEPVVLLAFRYFRPVQSAAVELKDGAPVRVTATGLRGRVIDAAGPWHGSGDWWSHQRWDRWDWDVRLEEGGLYRLFATEGHWFLEGVYD
jgi:protein ImuB